MRGLRLPLRGLVLSVAVAAGCHATVEDCEALMSEVRAIQPPIADAERAMQARDAAALDRASATLGANVARADRTRLFEPDPLSSMRRDYVLRGRRLSEQLTGVARAIRRGDTSTDALVAQAHRAGVELNQSLDGVMCANFN